MKDRMNLRINLLLVGSICIGVIFLAIVFYGSMRRRGRNPLEEFSDSRPLIGFSIDSMVIERWQHDVDIFKTKAEELGYRVEITNAYEDPEKQIEQIRMLGNEGAKAIVIVAYDKNGLADVVEEMKNKNIIVIAYDRLIMHGNVDAYISFDNVAVGEYMAGALLDVQPKGNYVIINGAPTDHNATMFNEGYYNKLTPYIQEGHIRILEEVWAENWREEFAYNTIRQLLEKGEKIDAVIGANDRIAEGAISVFLEYGQAGEVPIVGHDADISACQNIVEGKQLMTVYKPIKILAEGAVETVDRFIRGEDIAYGKTIYDGTYGVPYIQYDVIPVYEYNIGETVIKDLFHQKEDIYLKQ